MTTLVKPSLKAEAIHSENVWALAWSNDRIVTGSLDGTVKLWECNSAISLHATSKPYRFGVTSIASTQDGLIVVASYQNGIISFMSGNDMKEFNKVEAGLMETYSICLSPNDDVLATGTQKGHINIWSMPSPQLLSVNDNDDMFLDPAASNINNHKNEKVATLETNNNFILSCIFNVDAKLAVSSFDGMVNVFDVMTQKIVHKIQAHALPVRSVKYSPDGRLLYTASDDRHVGVYDTVSGTVINNFSHKGMCFTLDTAPDGRHFVVGCADSTVCLWDLGMQRKLQSFEQHQNIVWGVCYKKNIHDTAGVSASSTAGRRDDDAKMDQQQQRKQVFASVGDDALLQLYE